MFEDIFKNRSANTQKLLAFGFEKTGAQYKYQIDMLNGQFAFIITLDSNQIQTQLIDNDSQEPYTLHLSDAEGAFVGKIRSECQNFLQQIADNCFENTLFKNPQTLELLHHIKETYQDFPEFLWEKFPDNAVIRRKDNKKWYAAFLTVAPQKLNLNGNRTIEIIDLRGNPQEISVMLDNKTYFPGYHMNKKNWYTICLNDSVDTPEICARIAQSYQIAAKK